MSISEHVQRSDLGARVVLFHIDLSMFGETDLYITPGDEGAPTHAVTFNGQVYSPYPIETEGFIVSGTGPLPRPTITIANTSGILTALVRNNSNLAGAILERVVTFAKFLDNGSDPDPTAILTRDLYIIRRKVADNPRRGVLKFELASIMDLVDTYLPGRVVVRDFCDHSYRVYDPDTDDFDYSKATCPYNGTVYLNEQDLPCEKSEDRCSKRLTGGCKGRFGANAELPYRGFPGVSRFRAR